MMMRITATQKVIRVAVLALIASASGDLDEGSTPKLVKVAGT